MLDVQDIAEIHQLLNRYGHVIDDRRWDDLGRLFTDDVFFDVTNFGVPPLTSLADLRRSWSSDLDQHPLAHHATNIVVDDGDPVRVASKGVCPLKDGRVASIVYHDELRRTEAGWRISRRVATRLRP